MVDAVVCRALRVVRGGNEVLRGIDLTVRAGEVTGLLGPSGGGKTTAMRSLVGTVSPAGWGTGNPGAVA